MKVAIKNKTEWKYIDAGDVELDGKKLKDLYEEFAELKHTYKRLVNLLQTKLILEPNKEYLVESTEGLKKINGLQVHDVPKGTIPAKYYKVENGKLVVDRKKVGAAW